MKRQFKDYEHLVRLGAIAVFGLLMFAVARAALVPDSFGRYGHYRAAAVDEIRSKPIVYAPRDSCADCHTDIVELRKASLHNPISCQTCHGPLAKHAESGENAPQKPDPKMLCARCHAANTGKPKWYPTVDVKDHAGDESCVTCHQPHNPKIS
jgi:uncharacterized CHY-type Zn-finger protein